MEQETLLIVQGKSGQGKTPTIKQVAKQLINDGGEIIKITLDEDPENIMKTICGAFILTPSTDLNHIDKPDIFGIIEYKGVKVGINSGGDTPDQIKLISILIQHGCPLIVGCCRTKRATYSAIRDVGKDYKQIFIENLRTRHRFSESYITDVYENWNQLSAKGIVELIDNLIKAG